MDLTGRRDRSLRPSTGPRGQRPLDRLRTFLARVLVLLVAAAAVGLILAHGFQRPLLSHGVLTAVELVALAAFVAHRTLSLFPVAQAARQLRVYWLDYGVIAAAAAILLGGVDTYHHPVRRAVTIYLIVLATSLVVRYGLQRYQARIGAARSSLTPGKLIVISFVVVILFGAFLLSLPASSNAGLAGQTAYQWRDHAINCLFTSTSAVCVTGLTVYRTGHDFTFAGQVIILILIQIGGLGIMVMGTVFAMLAGRQLGLRETVVMQDALSQGTIGQISRMVKFVCLSTFVMEGIGAVILYPMWTEQDVANGGRWFWSVFHAVSAFCNAGFSLHDDNLVPYRRCWQVYGSIMTLVILGGLGFPVLHEVYAHSGRWIRNCANRFVARARGQLAPVPIRPRRYTLHTKLALTTTLVLILGGAVLLWFLETPAKWTKRYEVRLGETIIIQHAPDQMCSMTPGERWWAALFLSVTPRTAGFNTCRMDEQSLSSATHYLLCLLMFVGGSPASTAGGIKTVTFAVLVLAVRATLRGRRNAEAFRRTISLAVVERAFVVTALMFAMVFLVTWLLCYVESRSLLALLFETVSASGTVGLSTGITPSLTKAGRLLIIVCMFAGRVGPLTLLVALAGRTRAARYDYPEEEPIIG